MQIICYKNNNSTSERGDNFFIVVLMVSPSNCVLRSVLAIMRTDIGTVVSDNTKMGLSAHFRLTRNNNRIYRERDNVSLAEETTLL